jgi:uncharacterized protein YjbJ (UPF0337 family)
MLSDFPSGVVPDLRPEEAREAKATADLVVRRVSTGCRDTHHPEPKILPTVDSSLRLSTSNDQERVMDKDRVKGAAHEAKGTVKEAVGKVTGDTKTQAEGVAEKAAGKAQNAVGGVKDAIKK